MAKALRTAALVVGAVALVAATAGIAAPAVAATATTAASAGGIAGVSAATLTAIGTYASLAAGVLSVAATLAMPKPSVHGNATTFTTNPQSGLPYAMGRTRMSGLRFFADTNSRPGYTKFNDLLWFGALLSIGGAIHSIESFAADGVAVTFDASGNAIGTYHDYMGQKLHLGGPQSAAVNLTLGGGAAPGWTSQHKLSGVTHAMWCLRFNKQGEMFGAGAPEPAWVGKWVKVYDPRLDSTYPGGSGSCRALDETTYVWSQNPGLHALTWALGRWQNGKRTCGIGAPIANIRVAEFVECANICDANGWKVGGVEWTTDSKWATMKRILQAGGARPTKSRGMIGCLVSAPRTAIATIESRHLLDKLQLNVTKSRRDRFNSVIPRFVDERSDWALISGTSVSVADFVTADRGPRTKEIDYPLVQVFDGEEAKQPAELAAYDICNSREAGPFTWSTGPEWIGIKTGDVINLNVPEEGLVNQPILITKATPDPATGKISFAGETETHSKHDFALGRTTTPPPPFALTAPDLKPPAPANSNWAVSGSTTGEGLPAIVVAGTSELPSADAILIEYRKAGTEDWLRAAILSAQGQLTHVIAPLESLTQYEVRVGYRVGPIDGNFTVIGTATTGSGKLTGIEAGADVTGNHTAADTAAVAGRAAADLIAQSDVNTESILAEILRQDEFQAVMDARTFVEGQAVGTKFLEFRDAQQLVNAAFVVALSLIGAKSADGTAWNLNMDTVRVAPGKSFAQHLEEVGLTTAQIQATVQFLMQVMTGPDGTEARAVVKTDLNGNIASLVLSSGEEISQIGLIADRTVIAKPDGTVLAAFGMDGDLVYVPNLKVDHISVGAMTPEFLAGQSLVTGQGSQMLPGGVIMKWGEFRANISDEVQLTVLFDTPFPNACLSFVPVPYLAVFSNERDLWLQLVGPKQKTGVTVATQSSTANSQLINGFDWIAFGR